MCVLFTAVIDRACGDAFTGVIGLINTSPTNLVTEIAWAVRLPESRCPYVTNDAIGLFLIYCLELPSRPAQRPGSALESLGWASGTCSGRHIPELAICRGG